jgi:hypothetical protein
MNASETVPPPVFYSLVRVAATFVRAQPMPVESVFSHYVIRSIRGTCRIVAKVTPDAYRGAVVYRVTLVNASGEVATYKPTGKDTFEPIMETAHRVASIVNVARRMVRAAALEE